MEKERVEILQEIKANGGFNSSFFGGRAKVKNGKGMSKLRDDSGTVVTEEEVVAGIARAHLKHSVEGSGRIVLRMV